MSSATNTPPVPKYASNTDFTNSLVGFTIALVILSTVAITARTYARLSVKNISFSTDDIFALLGYVGLLLRL